MHNDSEKIFSCTRCGFCCQGQVTVSLNKDDQARMVTCLGKEAGEVRQKYWKVNGSLVQMKTVDGHCIFYDNGCTVHAGRPWRCAQWPLVPALLSDKVNFETIKESCPGINRELSYDQFCKILSSYLDHHNNAVC
jgi:hypothetical protein